MIRADKALKYIFLSFVLLFKLGCGYGQEIKLKVEDVLFKQDQFQVKLRGGLVIHLKDAPKVGQVIRVKVQVECLA